MKREDLRDVLELVKTKIQREAEAACGMFWVDCPEDDDPQPSTCYAVGEEDGNFLYAVSE